MPHYIKLPETGSTNSYLLRMANILPGGSVIYTLRQTAGRGQKGNSWESEDGKNLSFSYLLKWPALEAKRQFFISEATSIAVRDMLSQFAPDIKIKWPNDIYYRDQKICGMLIESSLEGRKIAHSVLGIGININQEIFRSDAPNPVSLTNITGDKYILEELLHDVCNRIEALCNFSNEETLAALHQRYLQELYRNDGKAHKWELPDGSQFFGTIVGVEPDGVISIRKEDGTEGLYYFKEVKHVINEVTL